MVYLMSLHLTGTNWVNFQELDAKLTALNAKPFIQKYVWLVESDETAMVLYLQIAPLLSGESEKLLITEITTNSMGTYVARNDVEFARLIGRARPV